MKDKNLKTHWRASLRLTGILLVVWFTLGFLGPILCRDWLDANFPSIGNAPFAFWMAQQGSIIGFVLILIIYAIAMNRIDEEHGYTEED